MKTYYYRKLHCPIAIATHCNECTGVEDCFCEMAESKIQLTEEQYNTLFPDTIAISNQPDIPLGSEVGAS